MKIEDRFHGPTLRSAACSSLLMLSLACATGRPAGGEHGAVGPDPVIEVENAHWQPVRVYAVWSGGRYFLGEVTPGHTGRYAIPPALFVDSGQLRFLAQPRSAADEYVTAPVSLDSSARFHWLLKRNLHTSKPRRI